VKENEVVEHRPAACVPSRVTLHWNTTNSGQNVRWAHRLEACVPLPRPATAATA